MKKLSLFVCFATLMISGCANKKFDSTDWNYGDGIEYPNRDNMLDDLLTNHPLKGLKYSKVVGLLNQPQGRDSSSIFYEIKITVNKNTKHISRKKLILYFNRDSVINNVAVKEN